MKKLLSQCDEIPDKDEPFSDCYLDNRTEAIIRRGGEPFLNRFEIEDSYYKSHIVDPSRSLVSPIVELMDWGVGDPHWSDCDCLSVLIANMEISRLHPSREDVIAFWTMFPDGVGEALSNSYMKDCSLLEKHRNTVRVLNNPFFHKDPNANERRLVEIAEDGGLRFALDRIAVLPSPEVLAREIALLNHGLRDPENVEIVRAKLFSSIAETMADWGLAPTLPASELTHSAKGENE